MTLEYIKEDIQRNSDRISSLVADQCRIMGDISILLESLSEVWYFIIATAVFTSIGIISVLTYLGV